MKREEAIADIKTVNRTCRGPMAIPEEERERLIAEWAPIGEAKDMEAGIAFKKRLENRIGTFDQEVTTWDALLQRVTFLTFCRMDIYLSACGYDVNEIIINTPWDGEMHETFCPKCNEPMYFIAPYYEIED